MATDEAPPNPTRITQRALEAGIDVPRFDARFEEVTRGLRTAVWIWDPDQTTHPIRWGNDAALRLWRAESLEDLQKRDFSSDTGVVQGFVHAHTQEFFSECGFTSRWFMFPKGEPVSVLLYIGLIWFDGQVCLLSEGRPYEGDKGEPETLRLFSATHYTSALFTVLKPSGELLVQNMAARGAYGPKPPTLEERFVDPGAVERLQEVMQSRVGDVRIFEEELQVRRVDGEHWHLVTVRRTIDPVSGQDAILIHELPCDEQRAMREALRDQRDELEATLEELSAAQTQLVLSEKMASLGNLVAGVAHEINTPLGAMISAAETNVRALTKLQEGADSERMLRLIERNTKVINEGGRRVGRIVQVLRNFARLDEAELQEALLEREIEDTLLLMGHRIGSEIDVTRTFAGIRSTHCRPSQINQVFMNILGNAVDAIEAQAAEVGADFRGAITIRTEQVEGSIRIEIEDNGRGIAPQHASRIFDPGFTTKGVGVGTGLGLSICYKIVAAHEGRLEIHSDGLGQGCVARLTLPINIVG